MKHISLPEQTGAPPPPLEIKSKTLGEIYLKFPYDSPTTNPRLSAACSASYLMCDYFPPSCISSCSLAHVFLSLLLKLHVFLPFMFWLPPPLHKPSFIRSYATSESDIIAWCYNRNNNSSTRYGAKSRAGMSLFLRGVFFGGGGILTFRGVENWVMLLPHVNCFK